MDFGTTLPRRAQQVAVRVTPEENRALRALARRKKVRLSDLLREAVALLIRRSRA